MQKLKLDNAFYLDEVVVYGLVSQLPSYRMAFFLNQSLDLKLSRAPEDKKFQYKKNDLFYSTFTFEDIRKDLDWFLVANKNPVIYETQSEDPEDQLLQARIVSGLPLVPNLKLMDYFLGYYGEENHALNQNINLQLKELSYVSTLQKIDVSQTKNIEHILIA